MPTFRSVEVVDAWQFTGDIDNAKELVARVKAIRPDYRSSELNIAKGISMLGSTDPVVEVPVPCLHIDFGKEPKDWCGLTLMPDAWLVHRQDGRLQVFPPEHFKKKYDQV